MMSTGKSMAFITPYGTLSDSGEATMQIYGEAHIGLGDTIDEHLRV